MRPPSKKEAVGYDIVVWVDEEGDIVARGFSVKGHNALKTMVNRYHAGDIVQIYCSPDEFMVDIPDDVAVGTLNSKTKKIGPYAHNHLH